MIKNFTYIDSTCLFHVLVYVKYLLFCFLLKIVSIVSSLIVLCNKLCFPQVWRYLVFSYLHPDTDVPFVFYKSIPNVKPCTSVGFKLESKYLSNTCSYELPWIGFKTKNDYIFEFILTHPARWKPSSTQSKLFSHILKRKQIAHPCPLLSYSYGYDLYGSKLRCRYINMNLYQIIIEHINKINVNKTATHALLG